MPFSNPPPLRCRCCRKRAGILQRDHPGCHRAHQAGWQEMLELAAGAARSHQFDEKTLRSSLSEIARRSFGDGNTVNQALEEGWKLGVGHAMSDSIITEDEEARLREFRNQLALEAGAADQKAAAQLEKHRLTGSRWTPGSPPSPPKTPTPT